MISVLVLTLNEECNIAECIESLPAEWREDLLVLDSNSTDKTRDIAASLGARVVVRSFDDYANQRNAGLSQHFDHDWILMLDADERMTPELAQEIKETLSICADSVGIFRVRRKDMFMGRWLKRSSGYPTYFPRLFRKGAVRVERSINEEYKSDLRTEDLAEHLYHFPFNKGMTWWYQRHAKYAAMEASLLVEGQNGAKLRLLDLLASDHGTRRSALKRIAYKLPGRPTLVFLYLLFIRGGVRDGRAGYQYASMRSAYERMIDAILIASRFDERP